MKKIIREMIKQELIREDLDKNFVKKLESLNFKYYSSKDQYTLKLKSGNAIHVIGMDGITVAATITSGSKIGFGRLKAFKNSSMALNYIDELMTDLS